MLRVRHQMMEFLDINDLDIPVSECYRTVLLYLVSLMQTLREAHIQFQVNQDGLVLGIVAVVEGFLWVVWFFPCQHHSTKPSYLYLIELLLTLYHLNRWQNCYTKHLNLSLEVKGTWCHVVDLLAELTCDICVMR